MCNSNAPTSMIEQGIVVRCHSGSFISNGLEKKRQIMPDQEILRSLWSLLYVKKNILCDSQFLKTVEKKELTRKTCTRPSSLEEDSFSSTGFVDCLASSGLCWFPLVSIYGWLQSTVCFSARVFRQPALPRLLQTRPWREQEKANWIKETCRII